METPTVIVFSTPTCPYCQIAKAWLAQNGISYTEHNVAEDREAALKMIQKTQQMGVPQIWINDEVVLGFNEPQLKELLGIED
jgi:glutaredoxin 3